VSGEIAGPWFVDLSEARAPAEVGEVIATAVGCPPDTDLGVHIDALLDDRRGVLVLDHCDHLAPAARAAAEQLLDWCPTLQVIATTARELGVAGEASFEVPPLELPVSAHAIEVMRSASGRLLLERATSARPDIEMSDATFATAFDACHAVGGRPLHLELLAGLAAAGPLEQVARLARGDLDDVVDASVGALTRAEVRALTALTVPESPIAPSLASASVRAVSVAESDTAAMLHRLVRSGLIRLDADGRYALLVAVRSRVDLHVVEADRALVAAALLEACLQATAAETGPLSRYAPVAATASALLDEDGLPVVDRQRLAAQLAPWWRARFGPARARERLLAALRLSDAGAAAAALHLAIAASYPPGQETVDTERHVQRAAVLLGEHDAIDPAFVERLKRVVRGED
jgi:hypothetical protein